MEFALLLPMLALLVAAAQPVMGALIDHVELSRAVAAGARYATKVDANPGTADDLVCGDFSRRRTTPQVQEFVASTTRVIDDPGAVSVTTVTPSGDEVAHPCRGTATSRVTVAAVTTRSSGPIARAANALSAFLGGDGIFPPELTIGNEATATLE